MTQAVERCLAEDRVLLCEAGTGTGKTLAYLVPAILSGKKVVVSTATRALQEQIATQDLPLIASALGLEPRAAVMKGLANYVCRRRTLEFGRSHEATRPSIAKSLEVIQQWVEETETGDVVELAGLSENDPIWAEVTSSSETRVGPRCPHYEDCFATRMKRDAQEARLVIVNHHLFFADLALRGPHPARVIPDYDAVIFDEAHRLEDIATNFFGLRVSGARVDTLVRDAERLMNAHSLADPLFGGGGALLEEARRSSEAFWRAVTGGIVAPEGRVTLCQEHWTPPLTETWHRLDSAFEALGAFAETQAAKLRERLSDARRLEGAEALEQIYRRTGGVRDDLAAVIDGTPGRVTWLDTTGRRPALSSAPVDLSRVFRERVFESIPAVVLTSATLASAGSDGVGFEFLRSRVGLAGEEIQVDEAILASPFDFATSALLYTPSDLPRPNDDRFLPAAIRRIVDLVAVTGGGAFVLTTSVRSMRALHRGLSTQLPDLSVLVQGSAPKATLLSEFRASGNAVLVATMSFWEGVDVPGRALRLVVLEKIPFAVPTDPVGQARARALEADGRNSFLEFQVPAAAITLKQGFGRLVRTRADRGVVALLDERVHRRGYGRRLLDSLPPARAASTLDEVRTFWSDHA